MSSQFDIIKVTPDVLFIADQNLGEMSVTNDAESVCIWCHQSYPGRRIVYQDSEGNWDEICHWDGMFGGFSPYNGWHP